MSNLIQLHLNKPIEDILKVYAPNAYPRPMGQQYWVFDRNPILEGCRVLGKSETRVGAIFDALKTV
jgi:hypothetical protein